MIATIAPHNGKEATGREMARLVKLYYTDLVGSGYEALEPRQFFDIVKNIPYREDSDIFNYSEGVKEILLRPSFLLNRQMTPALDCKKKAMLMAAHAQLRGYPWRFVAVREIPNDKFHHVFTQIFTGGNWVNVDATFPSQTWAMKMPLVQEAEVIS